MPYLLVARLLEMGSHVFQRPGVGSYGAFLCECDTVKTEIIGHHARALELLRMLPPVRPGIFSFSVSSEG